MSIPFTSYTSNLHLYVWAAFPLNPCVKACFNAPQVMWLMSMTLPQLYEWNIYVYRPAYYWNVSMCSQKLETSATKEHKMTFLNNKTLNLHCDFTPSDRVSFIDYITLKMSSPRMSSNKYNPGHTGDVKLQWPRIVHLNTDRCFFLQNTTASLCLAFYFEDNVFLRPNRW